MPAAPGFRDVAALRARIGRIGARTGGRLTVVAVDVERGGRVGIDGDAPVFMSSVVKLPLAVQLLARVDRGELRLGDSVTIAASDLRPGHSPLAAAHPGGLTTTVAMLLQHALSASDNTASDALLRYSGGPARVARELRALGVAGVRVDRGYADYTRDYVGMGVLPADLTWTPARTDSLTRAVPPARRARAARRFRDDDDRDRATAAGLAALLTRLARGELLAPASRTLLLRHMTESANPATRLVAGAPAGASVAHKTGTWGGADGVLVAVNDVGIVSLPNDGGRLVIAVLVRAARVPLAGVESAIAEATRAVVAHWRGTAPGGAGAPGALPVPSDARPFHGVAVVADDTTIVGVHVSGARDRARGVPHTLRSRFVVGSVSKQVTAAVAMRLVDQGRLDLDAPLRRYVRVNAAWDHQVTTRHLLTHTSGVAAPDGPLRSTPGATFAYSGLVGYGLIGAVVERAAGEPYAMQAGRLFGACGMHDSAVLDSAAAAADTLLSTGYVEAEDGSLQPTSPAGMARHAPSGGVVTTASDLVRWSRCLHGGRAVSQGSYAAMTHAWATRPHRWGALGYGFGLQLSTPRERPRELSHGGAAPGFIATLAYYPDTRRTLVVLENVAWRDDSSGTRGYAPHDRVRARLRAEVTERPTPTRRSPAGAAPPGNPHDGALTRWD